MLQASKGCCGYASGPVLNGGGGGKRVTWLLVSCRACGSAAGLLPVRRWEKERKRRERWSVVVPEEERPG